MQIGQDGLFQSLYLQKWAAKVEGGITMKTRKSLHCPLYCGRKISYTVIATNELAV